MLQSIHFSIEVDSIVIDSVRRCNLESQWLQPLGFCSSLFNGINYLLKIVFKWCFRCSLELHFWLTLCSFHNIFQKILATSAFGFAQAVDTPCWRCWALMQSVNFWFTEWQCQRNLGNFSCPRSQGVAAVLIESQYYTFYSRFSISGLTQKMKLSISRLSQEWKQILT